MEMFLELLLRDFPFDAQRVVAARIVAECFGSVVVGFDGLF